MELDWLQISGISGIIGLSLAIVYKLLEFGIAVVKSKLNVVSSEDDQVNTARKLLTQSEVNGLLLEGLRDDFFKLNMEFMKLKTVVIDGNGKDGLVTQVAVLKTEVKAHVSDPNIHKRV